VSAIKREIDKRLAILGISQCELSRRIGMYSAFIALMIRGNVRLHKKHAKALASLFPDTHYQYWMNLFKKSKATKSKEHREKLANGELCPTCGKHSVKVSGSTKVCVELSCRYMEDVHYDGRSELDRQVEITNYRVEA
jgi:plasmid maintenance system antidote protein VapI